MKTLFKTLEAKTERISTPTVTLNKKRHTVSKNIIYGKKKNICRIKLTRLITRA